MKFYYPFLLFILFFQLNLNAQNSLQQAINTFVDDPVLQHASVSISVLDLALERQVAGYQSMKSLIPASSLKVLTTASALSILGTDYRFKTEIQYDGHIDDNGVLSGNIYIKGYGDPTLGSDQIEGVPELEDIMERFRLSLQRKGIREIKGYIIADATHFESAANAPTWQWNDMGNYYASGVFGLNIHENFYYLKFRQTSRLGAIPTIAKVQPYVKELILVNEVTSAGSNTGDNAYIFGAPYNYYRYVRGTIPIGSGLFTIKGSIPDPPLFTAQYLLDKLDEIGIKCEKGATTIRRLSMENMEMGKAPRMVLSAHYSPSLQLIVERANQKSINLYCESMLKAIGNDQKNEGTTKAGIKAIQEHWESKGMEFDGCFLEDGSGLSPRNGVSSYFLASLMLKIKKETALYEVFEPSLPIAGETGTLRYFLSNTAAQGKIKAKSGSISRVRSYTGYVETKTGRTLSFAIMVNNYSSENGSIKAAFENLMLAMYNE